MFAVAILLHINNFNSILLEGIASCLTELLSSTIIADRVGGMLAIYDFITADTLGYFTPRLDQAPMDAKFALDYVKQHARTPEQQQAVLAVLRTKCDILWAMLDALRLAYLRPAMIPPGASVPSGR
jgi:pyrroloquinoline-quinone synthase